MEYFITLFTFKQLKNKGYRIFGNTIKKLKLIDVLAC